MFCQLISGEAGPMVIAPGCAEPSGSCTPSPGNPPPSVSLPGEGCQHPCPCSSGITTCEGQNLEPQPESQRRWSLHSVKSFSQAKEQGPPHSSSSPASAQLATGRLSSVCCIDLEFNLDVYFMFKKIFE